MPSSTQYMKPAGIIKSSAKMIIFSGPYTGEFKGVQQNPIFL